jgi:hypothetical protein
VKTERSPIHLFLQPLAKRWLITRGGDRLTHHSETPRGEKDLKE